MVVRYIIEDMNGTGLDVTVDFEFHRELDGQIVYDGAFTIRWTEDGKMMQFMDLDYLIPDVIRWMADNEYRVAPPHSHSKEFSYA